jgi:hypothetical protein
MSNFSTICEWIFAQLVLQLARQAVMSVPACIQIIDCPLHLHFALLETFVVDDSMDYISTDKPCCICVEAVGSKSLNHVVCVF